MYVLGNAVLLAYIAINCFDQVYASRSRTINTILSHTEPSMSSTILQQAVESRRALAVCLFVTIAAFQFGYDSSYYSGMLC